MNFIRRVAFTYKDNTLAKVLIRPFYRVWVAHTLNKKKKLFRLNAKLLLKKLKEALDSNGIHFWLEFGTLLGAYREHGFIKHDYDLDIGVFFENTTDVYDALTKADFRLIREFKVDDDGINGFEQTYEYAGVAIDVFFFHKKKNEMYCNSFSPFEDEIQDFSLCQVKKISVPDNGFIQIKFEGMALSIPAETEKYLQAHYGINFMTPNEYFDYRKEATNIYYYSRLERTALFTSWE